MTDSAAERRVEARPSYSPTPDQRRELLRAAKEKVLKNEWDPVDPFRLARSLRALGIFGEDIPKALVRCLEEIQPRDYRGDFPPEASYEDACKGAQLFPFAWNSDSLGKSMYLKIAIHDERLKVVTFHPQRREAKR